MARVERLQQVGRLGAAHLADDDVVRAVPQRVLDEIPDRDAALAELARLEADAVLVADGQLQGVLDGHDPVVHRKQLDQGVEEGRLPGSGASGDEDVPPAEQGLADERDLAGGERPQLDEVVGRESAGPESADGDGGGRRGRSNADGHAAAVFEPRVDDRHGGRIEPQRPRDVDGRAVQRGRVQVRSGNGREPGSGALHPYVAGTVDHQLGDLHVVEQLIEPGQEGLEVLECGAHRDVLLPPPGPSGRVTGQASIIWRSRPW